MSEKAEKKPEAPAKDAASAPKEGGAKEGGSAPAAKKGGIGALMTKLPVMLGGVMVVEAAVLFAGFKFLGSSPRAAAGADLTTAETETVSDEHGNKKDEHGGGSHGKEGDAKPAGPKRKTVELQVLDFKAQNKTTGRMFMYDVSIYVVTKFDFETKVKDTIKANEALIKDRVRTIIAQNDPEKLGGGSEPGLETLRRQIKHQLDEIIGEGMVQEVLVPKCIPFRTDY
jgi:flagellar basal body-associated protein FliL